MTDTTEPSSHILVINHSPDVIALMVDLLEEEGFRVTTRPDHDRDIASIAAIAPDLIIIDYMWTTSNDEWSFLQMLRISPTTTQIPIVLCTGAVREAQELENHLKELRVRVVLKPFEIDQLLIAIREELGRRGEIFQEGRCVKELPR